MNQTRIDNITYYLQHNNTFPDKIIDKDRNFINKHRHKFVLLKEGLFYIKPFEAHCYKKVLNSNEAKEAFIQFHYHPLGGHLAYSNTYFKIAQKYFWETMAKDIQLFIKECEMCQHHGNKTINERLNPIPVPVLPWKLVSIDVKHVTTSQSGHRYIVAAIDHLTKYVEATALRQQTASEIAEFIVSKIITIHGTAVAVHSDNGRPMVGEIVEQVCNAFGMRHRTISPYNHTSAANIERFFRTYDLIMKKRSTEEKKNWPDYLDATLFAYRTIKQDTTQQSPFYLMYGYEPSTPFDNTMIPLNIDDPRYEAQLIVRTGVQIRLLNQVRQEAWTKIKKSQERQIKRTEAKIMNIKREFKPGFRVGDVVKLYRDNIATSFSAKIMIRWFEDKFVIDQKLRFGTYYIKNISNPDDTRLRLVHGNRLKAYVEPHYNWVQHANLISINHPQ